MSEPWFGYHVVIGELPPESDCPEELFVRQPHHLPRAGDVLVVPVGDRDEAVAVKVIEVVIGLVGGSGTGGYVERDIAVRAEYVRRVGEGSAPEWWQRTWGDG